MEEGRNEWMNEIHETKEMKEMNEGMNEWMNEWMKWMKWNEMKWNECVNEWMNERTKEWTYERTKWHEMKLNETKWNEVKQIEGNTMNLCVYGFCVCYQYENTIFKKPRRWWSCP